jgi:hypothetical protein
MSRPGIKPRPPTVGGEHYIKELHEQHIKSYLEHLHMFLQLYYTVY